jgi:hypothetical protein
LHLSGKEFIVDISTTKICCFQRWLILFHRFFTFTERNLRCSRSRISKPTNRISRLVRCTGAITQDDFRWRKSAHKMYPLAMIFFKVLDFHGEQSAQTRMRKRPRLPTLLQFVHVEDAQIGGHLEWCLRVEKTLTVLNQRSPAAIRFTILLVCTLEISYLCCWMSLLFSDERIALALFHIEGLCGEWTFRRFAFSRWRRFKAFSLIHEKQYDLWSHDLYLR